MAGQCASVRVALGHRAGRHQLAAHALIGVGEHAGGALALLQKSYTTWSKLVGRHSSSDQAVVLLHADLRVLLQSGSAVPG